MSRRDLPELRRHRRRAHGTDPSPCRCCVTGEAIGVIGSVGSEVDPFTERRSPLLETFADQAVIAIENARLFEELQERTAQLTRSVGELRALGEVSQAVSSSLDLHEVLSTIVAHADAPLGADGGTVYEFDETERRLPCCAPATTRQTRWCAIGTSAARARRPAPTRSSGHGGGHRDAYAASRMTARRARLRTRYPGAAAARRASARCCPCRSCASDRVLARW